MSSVDEAMQANEELRIAAEEVREARKWIAEKMGVGGGFRPLSFLIASHEEMARELARVHTEPPPAPTWVVPMLLSCPECGTRHVDQGEYATKPHHTHACQTCGMVWRPAVVNTVGVRFLPGFKDPP